MNYPRTVISDYPAPDLPHNARQWKLVLCYDGTDFHGWQVQPDLITIQGELQQAIERITGERMLPQGSGRTDAGVHALGQVASFPLAAPIPPANFLRALNRTLPQSIRILSAETVPDDFHARHSACGKSYEYRIFRGEICPPFLARYVYTLNWPLDFAAMQAAATAVTGEHDFTSFAATDPDLTQRQEQNEEEEPLNNVRTIFSSHWIQDGDLFVYRVHGSGFLHHMVRNLVGTFLAVGRGLYAPEDLPGILEARSRPAAGPTAPARGLFLVSVDYPAGNGIVST
jgi:tRNA pseudouridine38-40 synthase